MNAEEIIATHYQHGTLLSEIESALAALGKSLSDLRIEDLTAVDEFHVGGRRATEHLLNQLPISEVDTLLDIGCGLGGSARFVAKNYDKHVTGIDLTSEFIQTGNELSKWVNLDNLVRLITASAVNMPFQNASFDCAYMQHVGMNIKSKTSLFREVYRVLKPNSYFGIYDIMRINNGPIIFPVPWAEDASMSHLSTLKQYTQALIESGFEVLERTSDSVTRIKASPKQNKHVNKAKPQLSLHTLFKNDPVLKFNNLKRNVRANLIAPLEVIAYKS